MNKFIVILLVVGMSYNVHGQNTETNKKAVKCNGEQIAGKTEFKPLPYAFDALEPYIDKLTVEIHYGKHFLSYYN